MADIRINALPTTATDFASDDYIAIDGTTNGTRKLNAKTANLTFSDVTLGTSGPSVKSTLSARAPRQGLVFDGTKGADLTTLPAFGTSDFTVSTWVKYNAAATTYEDILGGAVNSLTIARNASGLIQVSKTGIGAIVYSTSTVPVGKFTLVTVTRSGNSWTVYFNGVSDNTATVSSDLTVGCSFIGCTVSLTTEPINGTILEPLIYNRALSASEVVALYEAGAPAGADYNSASNTSLSTSALTAFSPFTLYSTFSSANGTSFSASDASANRACATNASFSVSAGQKILVSFTLTQSGSDFPQVILCDPTGPTDSSNAVVSTAGANNITLTATRAGTVRVRFFSFAASNYSVANLSVTRLGLLLAPDAAQAGGGLVWYDTSGNAANITLPASGVSWNVPTSGKVATGWAFGGDVGIGTTTPGKRLEVNKNLATNTVGAGEVVRLISDDGNNVGRITEIGFGVGPTGATYAPVTLGTVVATATGFNKKDFYIATRDSTTDSAPSERLRLFANGNLFVGASPVDGGQKLQVSGTGYFSGDLSSAGIITSAGANDGYFTATRSTTSRYALLTYRTGASDDWVIGLRGSGEGFSDDLTYRNGSGTVVSRLSKSGDATFAGDINLKSVVTTPTVKNILAGGNYSGVNNVLNSRCQMGADLNGDYGAWFGASYDGAQIHNWVGTRNGGTDYTLIDLMGGGSPLVKLGGALRLNNAYVAGAPTATGYVTIQDSAGNTYKVLVGT